MLAHTEWQLNLVTARITNQLWFLDILDLMLISMKSQQQQQKITIHGFTFYLDMSKILQTS